MCDVQEIGEDKPRILPTGVVQYLREECNKIIQDMLLRGGTPDNVGVISNQESDRDIPLRGDAPDKIGVF